MIITNPWISLLDGYHELTGLLKDMGKSISVGDAFTIVIMINGLVHGKIDSGNWKALFLPSMIGFSVHKLMSNDSRYQETKELWPYNFAS